MKTMIENIRKYDPFYVADIQLETMEISEAQFRAGLRYSAGGIPGAILRHIRSRYPGAVMEQIFDMTSSFFDFSHSTWDSKDLHRVIQNLDDDSHKEVDYTSLILSDRIDGDMLLPKLRTGQPVHFADVSMFIANNTFISSRSLQI